MRIFTRKELNTEERVTNFELMLIDTHSHVNFNAFKDDADEVINKSLEKGIYMINVGSQYSTSVRAIEIAKKYKPKIWAAIGLHPIQLQRGKFEYHDDNELAKEEISTTGEEFNYNKYLALAKNPEVVAIGEVGLDYHHFNEGDNILKMKEKQEKTFVEFIELANEVNKPIIVHCWDAYEDLYEILKNNTVERRGVVHSFVGGYKTARKFIELGYKIGLNGVITYSDSFHCLIKELDLKDIVLETDCPYLSPVPKKGERNVPMNVKYVAEKIAEIKNTNYDEVTKITAENAIQAFNLTL
jgi:TatD DNase family protein